MNPNSETMANTEAVPQAYNLSFGALCRGAMGNKTILTTGVHRFIVGKTILCAFPLGNQPKWEEQRRTARPLILVRIQTN